MPAFIFANNVSTTLANPITSTTQTSITLTSSANLPTIAAGQIFVLTLNDAATQSVFEVLYCTARSGATLTVTRGQEGTAATTWLGGDYAYGSVTAAMLGDFANVTTVPNFVPGIQTASILLNGLPVPNVQRGQVTVAVASGSNVGNVQVTFGTAFGANPRISLTLSSTGGEQTFTTSSGIAFPGAQATIVTPTSFYIVVYSSTTAVSTGAETFTVDWVATQE
jgi:hypothetical protein